MIKTLCTRVWMLAAVPVSQRSLAKGSSPSDGVQGYEEKGCRGAFPALFWVAALLLAGSVAHSQVSLPAPGDIGTVAGYGTAGSAGDGGAATAADLDVPAGIAVDADGNLYIADMMNNRIRKVTASSGIITTVAGNGSLGYSGDWGLATNAELFHPSGVAVDAQGNLYIADESNNVIRKITASTGDISTVAGSGGQGYSGDGGPATSAMLYLPMGVAVDASGNIYIADQVNNRIRKVTVSTGIITTVAGNGTLGFSGDGGQATSAELETPLGVAVDASGNLYIADDYNQRIRMVASSTGDISTVAGNGTAGFGGDTGAATASNLRNPMAVAVDAAGNIYIDDLGNQRIRKVTAATGIITTIAGNGTAGYSGDEGPAINASLNYPAGVAVDKAGNIYIADESNNRVRAVAQNKTAPTVTWTTPSAITYGTALSATQLDATASVPGTFAYSPGSGTVLTAGSQTLSVTFTPTDEDDYKAVTATVPLTVNKATSTITWATPAPISYGIALSSVQLNASSGSVSGSFAYSPAAGTVLGAGSHTLSVTFTPTDTNDYTSASGSVSLVVNKSTPTVTWATPSPIPYGTALRSTQLDATTGGIAGSFAYSPASGVVLAVGSQTLSVMFTPTDTADYNSATATVVLIVSDISTATAVWSGPTSLALPQVGQPFSLTAQVFAPSPTGTVTFSVDGASQGSATLASATATNLAPQSTWGASGGNWSVWDQPSTSHTIANATAPDGANTALSLTVTGSEATEVQQPSAYYAPYSSVTTYTFTVSVWAKSAAGCSALKLGLENHIAGDGYNASLPVTATWQRFFLTYTFTNASDDNEADTYLIVSAGCTVQLWGYQFEQASVAGPYIPTSGAPVSGTGYEATVFVSGLTLGTHSTTASYSGDADNSASTSGALSQTVQPAQSVSILSAAPTSTSYGQTVTLSSLVSTGGHVPTGTSTFFTNGSQIGSQVVSAVTTANQLPYSSTFTKWGTRGVTLAPGAGTAPDGTLTATSVVAQAGGQTPQIWQTIPYSSSQPGNTFTASVWMRVASGTAQTGLYLAGTDSVHGWTNYAFSSIALTSQWQRIEITGYVAPTLASTLQFYIGGGPFFQTGLVYYIWGAQVEFGSSPGPLVQTLIATPLSGSGGIATLSITTLKAGANAITSTYSGDANSSASTSTAVTVNVTSITPSITWGSPAAISYGTALSSTQLNATSGGVPGTFFYSPAIGTVLGAGSQTISVTFTPTDTTDYTTATATVTLTVNKASVVISSVSSLTPSLFGDNVTLTFTFTGGGVIPTGTTTISNGAATLATVPINAGVATYSTSALTAGSHALTAVYNGDSNYQ